MDEQLGAEVRELGQEFGTVTGRDRRPGWLDLVALRYAVRLNGITSLALTKLDVLSTFDELQVCVALSPARRDGDARLPGPPERLPPRRAGLRTVPGWAEPLDDCATLADLPEAARAYVEQVERELGVPVELVGTGAAREQVLARAS